MTTESVPHMALSASPVVPLDVRQSILNVLSNAHKSTDGRSMLKRTGLTEFVGTNAKEYSGYSTLLKDVFGYTSSVAHAYQ